MSNELDSVVCEEEAARLLPWLVAGRLDDADAERVLRHVEHCAICRSDLAHERQVRALLKSDNALAYAPQAGLQRTLARIDELNREVPEAGIAEPVSAAAVSARRFGASQWLTAAVVVQAVGLGLLGSALWTQGTAPGGARYQTMSSASPAPVAGPAIRAVFAPGMTLVELRGLLAQHGLAIVAGPNEAGALTLAVQDPLRRGERLEPLLAALRTDGRVLFAEPASNGSAWK